MPHSLSAIMPAAVSSTYTDHRIVAVSVMRGASRSSFTPGACALVELHAADPEQRQHRERHDDDAEAADPVAAGGARSSATGGSASRPFSTVEPVVVSPDMASKKAPVKDSPGMPTQQRQRRGRRQQQPAERHQQEAVARLQLAAEAAGGAGEQQAAAGGDRRR